MLVDDVPLVLESIRRLLDPYFTIVGAVQDSAEIMTRALESRPDVILLDACMPGLSGFAATKQLKKLLPTVKVILVTMLTESIFISIPQSHLKVKYVSHLTYLTFRCNFSTNCPCLLTFTLPW